MPTVSPDRRTIAFAVGSFTPTERHLAFVRSDGTGLRHLPAIADASEPGLSANGTYQPVWSPDGAHIAFLVEMSGGAGSRLWVMNADGTGARKLSATDFPDWYYLVERSPAWSPDGTRLLFSRDSNRVNFTSYAQLRTIRVDGSDLQAVPTGGVPAWGGDWSPAGDRIAFVGSTTSGNTLLMDLYVVGIDGSALVRVTNTPGQEGAVRWSPDGASLVFGSDFVVKRVRPDGTGLADVTSGRDPWWVR
jgi:Tol biopolymer transport system component